MGNIAGASNAPPIPKSQLTRILKRARKLAMRKMLKLKQDNIQERLQFYRVDAAKYKECIFGMMQQQQKMCQDTVLEVCTEQNVSIGSLTSAIRNHAIDPEVQEVMMSFQTMSGDICEGYPVPEQYDIETLKEGLRLQIRELSGYPINDPSASVLAQIASTDEVYKQMGIDEITFGSLALKYEKSADPEFLQLKQDWNQAAKFDMAMQGLRGK
ncbi:hypothetical protein SteCoe_619 [Stentor coeruleus]|uniref:Uncharacterized protein n=1 Tax=Stentor coeruleus TaxID=5963 RepID=A0A1R2D3Q6_9CILI|nr:hypothetical protein SteCoe_619 [Stentor coeruleus]